MFGGVKGKYSLVAKYVSVTRRCMFIAFRHRLQRVLYLIRECVWSSESLLHGSTFRLNYTVKHLPKVFQEM